MSENKQALQVAALKNGTVMGHREMCQSEMYHQQRTDGHYLSCDRQG